MSELLYSLSFSNIDSTAKDEKGIKNLILDLDGTLICSFVNPPFLETYGIYSDPVISEKFHPQGEHQLCYSMNLSYLPRNTNSWAREVNEKDERVWGLYRPHLFEFLSFADTYFDNIMVWSAGIDTYVREIIDKIFVQSGFRHPKLVWSRDHCAKHGDIYHKPIMDLSVKLKQKDYESIVVDPRNTIIVDDLNQNFMKNPDNGILIPAFQPGHQNPKRLINGHYQRIPTLEDLLDRSDRALLDLKSWLELPEVRNCDDVQILPKNNIFGRY